MHRITHIANGMYESRYSMVWGLWLLEYDVMFAFLHEIQREAEKGTNFSACVFFNTALRISHNN